MKKILFSFLMLLLLSASAAPWRLPDTGWRAPETLEQSFTSKDGEESGKAPSASRAADSAGSSGVHAWIDSIPEGDPETVISVFVPGVLAQPVVQQRSSLDVSEAPEEITQFRLAKEYGSIGMLAHNYLIGEHFFQIEAGDLAYVIYGDGHYQVYRVREIADYQALSLYVYRNLETRISLDQYGLIEKVYRGKNDRLVFQTCIEKNGALSWGRRFVIAELVSEAPAPRTEYTPHPGGWQPR